MNKMEEYMKQNSHPVHKINKILKNDTENITQKEL